MRPRPTDDELAAERVRRARARAAVVAQMPSSPTPLTRRCPVHDEQTSPVLIPAQRHHRGPRPGGRLATEMLGGPSKPRTAPLPVTRPRRWGTGWRIALVASAAFVLFLYLLPVGAASGWW